MSSVGNIYNHEQGNQDVKASNSSNDYNPPTLLVCSSSASGRSYFLNSLNIPIEIVLNSKIIINEITAKPKLYNEYVVSLNIIEDLKNPQTKENSNQEISSSPVRLVWPLHSYDGYEESKTSLDDVLKENIAVIKAVIIITSIDNMVNKLSVLPLFVLVLSKIKSDIPVLSLMNKADNLLEAYIGRVQDVNVIYTSFEIECQKIMKDLYNYLLKNYDKDFLLGFTIKPTIFRLSHLTARHIRSYMKEDKRFKKEIFLGNDINKWIVEHTNANDNTIINIKIKIAEEENKEISNQI